MDYEEEVSGGTGVTTTTTTTGVRGSGGGGPKCGRWNPTAEQVKVLTELFRSGLRTPTTEQIQSISSHLSSFGKIESKNVFYWFQNHKARERHHTKKRRRQPSPSVSPPDVLHLDRHHHGRHGSTTVKRSEAAAAVSNTTARSMSGYGIDFGGYSPPERVEFQTLELFPLSSYNEPLRITRNNHHNHNHRDASFFSAGKDMLLDLRLSSS